MSRAPRSLTAGHDRPKKRRWLAALGFNSLFVSILIHVFLALLAAYLIVEHFQKRHQEFVAAPVTTHAEVVPQKQLVQRNSPDSAPSDIIHISTTATTEIALPPDPVPSQNNEVSPSPMDGAGTDLDPGAGPGIPGPGGGPPPIFGDPHGQGLQGDFYDLKQTTDKTPTGMTDAGYLALLRSYAGQGWDDSRLAPFYQSQTPLYGSIFAITRRPSEAAPAAFGLESEVQPHLWIVHYHGRVQAPAAGTYRFAGFADDILLVRIKGVVVLDAGWSRVLPDPGVHSDLPFVFPAYAPNASATYDPHLIVGAPVQLEKNETVDMDILIGDIEGTCAFHLLVEKEGNKYDTRDDGTPEWPYFQLGDNGAPFFEMNVEAPPYSTKPEPWHLVPGP